jgi:acyl-CoA dehydrogenase
MKTGAENQNRQNNKVADINRAAPMIHNLQSEPVTQETIEPRFKDFGIRHISTYPDLHQQAQFPESLWEKMRQHHLFGIGIERKYDGQADNQNKDQSGPYRSLSIAGNAMAAGGGNLGVCLSWLIHELTALWLIQSVGTEDQKNDYLPGLASGKSTACLAISEPGVGAHPKHLATTAQMVSGEFILNGEKTYLTNAPMADLFIVVAVTGNMDGKKQFTAFLLPKNTPGLTVSPPLDFPFLHPAPHGGIVLKDCTVTLGQVLGTSGHAYEDLVLPFRTVENTMMMGPIAGGLAGLIRHFIMGLNHHQIIPVESVMAAIARLHCATEALTVIAEAAAGILDIDSRDESLTALGLFFRDQAGECLCRVRDIIEKTDMPPNPKLELMKNDLAAAIRIAENVSKIKLQKLGQRLFAQP